MTSLYKWPNVLDEALKSWEHFTADEIVYQTHNQRIGRDDSTVNAYAEAYRGQYSHVEVLIRSLRERHRYAAVLIQRTGREIGFHDSAIAEPDSHSPEHFYRKLMFVSPREEMEHTECIGALTVRPIQSVVRLKAFDDLTDGWLGDVFQWPSAVLDDTVEVIRTIIENREGGTFERDTTLASLISKFGNGQLPSDMVKSGAEVMNRIAQYRGHLIGVRRIDGFDEEIERSLRVVFGNNSIDYFTDKRTNPAFEIVDVKHRPFQFESGPIEWMLSIMSKQEKSQQKTEHGHEIPIPKRSEFIDNLKKAATPHEDDGESTTDDAEKE